MDDDCSTMDIAQVVTEHHAAVYRYAYRLTGAESDAEDLTQEVFLAAHQKLSQLRDVGSIRSWLFTILRNCFFKSRRKWHPVLVEGFVLDANSVSAEVPEDAVVGSEELQRALSHLPDKFRMILVMFYYEELSYREIAEQLNVPIGTVMSRLSRAKRHLRVKLFERIAEPAPEH